VEHTCAVHHKKFWKLAEKMTPAVDIDRRTGVEQAHVRRVYGYIKRLYYDGLPLCRAFPNEDDRCATGNRDQGELFGE